jgi:hypothetical protein
MTYDLTNTGSATCTMEGYPGVAVLNAQGHIVQNPAIRRNSPGTMNTIPVQLVTPQTGQHAEFVVASTDNVPVPGCPTYYIGTTLQVYPPNQTTPILKSGNYAICNLEVSPVHSLSS